MQNRGRAKRNACAFENEIKRTATAVLVGGQF